MTEFLANTQPLNIVGHHVNQAGLTKEHARQQTIVVRQQGHVSGVGLSAPCTTHLPGCIGQRRSPQIAQTPIGIAVRRLQARGSVFGSLAPSIRRQGCKKIGGKSEGEERCVWGSSCLHLGQ